MATGPCRSFRQMLRRSSDYAEAQPARGGNQLAWGMMLSSSHLLPSSLTPTHPALSPLMATGLCIWNVLCLITSVPVVGSSVRYHASLLPLS